MQSGATALPWYTVSESLPELVLAKVAIRALTHEHNHYGTHCQSVLTLPVVVAGLSAPVRGRVRATTGLTPASPLKRHSLQQTRVKLFRVPTIIVWFPHTTMRLVLFNVLGHNIMD